MFYLQAVFNINYLCLIYKNDCQKNDCTVTYTLSPSDCGVKKGSMHLSETVDFRRYYALLCMFLYLNRLSLICYTNEARIHYQNMILIGSNKRICTRIVQKGFMLLHLKTSLSSKAYVMFSSQTMYLYLYSKRSSIGSLEIELFC